MITVQDIEQMLKSITEAKTNRDKAEGIISSERNRLINEFSINNEQEASQVIANIEIELQKIDDEINILSPELKQQFGQ